MLATLFAHEVRTLGRWTLTALGLTATVVALGLLTLLVPLPDPVHVLIMGPIGVVLALTPVALFLYLLMSYWHSMYGRTGYFTFTLPARGRSIFFAKTLYMVLACMASLALSAAGALLLAWATERRVHTSYLHDVLTAVVDEWGLGVVVLGAVFAVLSIIIFVVNVTAVVSISAQSRWSHLGIAAPVIGFIIMGFVSGMLRFVSYSLSPLHTSVKIPEGTGVWRDMREEFLRDMPGHSDHIEIGWEAPLVYLLLAVVLCAWAVRAIERHTSLR